MSIDGLIEDLVRAALSVSNHDASEHEDGYIHEASVMEKKFRERLRLYFSRKRNCVATEQALVLASNTILKTFRSGNYPSFAQLEKLDRALVPFLDEAATTPESE